jgi:Fe-S-cluster containining protein
VDELQSSLLLHEQRMKGQKEEEQVLEVSNGGMGRARGGRCMKFNKETVECFKFHKLSHFQSECPGWKEDSANYAQFYEEEKILFMTQEVKKSKILMINMKFGF